MFKKALAFAIFIHATDVTAVDEWSDSTLTSRDDGGNEFILDFFLDGQQKAADERQPSSQPAPSRNAPASKSNTYIDIINDPKRYEKVKRSRTNDINSVWSITFLAFFGLETFLIGSFILFGLLMFVLLQCKPKAHEKHVTLFD